MEHATWMQRCLQLAANGAGSVAPNPMVGAVLVQGDAPKDLNLVTREEQARFVAAKANFKPLHQVMKEANVPLDGGKLAPELRVGLSDAQGNLMRFRPWSAKGATPPSRPWPTAVSIATIFLG